MKKSAKRDSGRETAQRRFPRAKDLRSGAQLGGLVPEAPTTGGPTTAVEDLQRADEPTTEVEDHPLLLGAEDGYPTPLHSPHSSEEELSPEGTTLPPKEWGEGGGSTIEPGPIVESHRRNMGKIIPHAVSGHREGNSVELPTAPVTIGERGPHGGPSVPMRDGSTGRKDLSETPKPLRRGGTGEMGFTPSRGRCEDFVLSLPPPREEAKPPFVLTAASLKHSSTYSRMSQALQDDRWKTDISKRNYQLIDDQLRSGYLSDWLVSRGVAHQGWQHLSNEAFLELLFEALQVPASASLGTVNLQEAVVTFVGEFHSSMVNTPDGEDLLTFTSDLRSISESQAVNPATWFETIERLCANIGTEGEQRERDRGRFYTALRQHLQTAWRTEAKAPTERTRHKPIDWLIQQLLQLSAQLRKAKSLCLTFGYLVEWQDLIQKDQRAKQSRVIEDATGKTLTKRTGAISAPTPPVKRVKVQCQGCGQGGHHRTHCWYHQHPNFHKGDSEFATTSVAKALRQTRGGATQLSSREWWDGQQWLPTQRSFQESLKRRREQHTHQGEYPWLVGEMEGEPMHSPNVRCCIWSTDPPYHSLCTSCLIDSGATQANYCDFTIAKALSREFKRDATAMRITLADGSTTHAVGTLTASVVIRNELLRNLYTCENLLFYIIPQLSVPIILGLPTIRQHRLTIIMPSFFQASGSIKDDLGQDGTCMRERGARPDELNNSTGPQLRHMKEVDQETRPPVSTLETLGMDSTSPPSHGTQSSAVPNPLRSEEVGYGRLSSEEEFIGKPIEDVFFQSVAPEATTSSTTPLSETKGMIDRIRMLGSTTLIERIRNLCMEFADVFTDTVRPTPADVPPMRLIVDQQKWRTGKNRGPPRFLSPAKEGDLQRQITKLIEYKILEPSAATEYSQVHMVPKPDGTLRFCIDYVKLNSATTASEGWPLQNISIMLQRIGSKTPRIFGKMDLTSGYHQAPLEDNSRVFSTFITSRGLFQWNRVPMGLKGAPSYFQRVMATTVLVGLVYVICEVYLDDILVIGASEEEFLVNLRKVLTRFRQHGITLNPAKCEFGGEEVEFVGHTISATGTSFSERKRSKVLDFPPPTTKRQLKGFIGLVNYFRDHVRNLSTLLVPFQELTNNYHPKEVVPWSERLQKAYEEIQQRVAACPALFFVDDTSPIYVQTDASEYGIGAYIFQKKEGREHPIRFVSKSLAKAQLNWSTIEKEAFAIYYTLKKYEYLLRDVRFILQTDHKNLTYVATAQSPKVRRWCLELQAYDFEIEHIAGESNVVADNLSRLCRNLPEREETLVPDNNIQLNAIVNELVIPEVRRKHIEQVHNSLVGHFGKERTIKLLLNSGHKWRHMRQHVSSYINECPVCQLRDPLRLQIETHKFTAGAYRPMEVINIDTIGPLQEDAEGYQYILVIIDCFTRFVELYATKDTSALPCARSLLSHVGRYGAPMYIRSDRGTQFVNGIIAEFVELVGSESQLTLAYSKQDNSIVERANKEVMRHLRAILFDKRIVKVWSMEYLPLVQRIINAQPHETIGVAPAELLFGKVVNLNRGMISPFIPEAERTIETERLSDYFGTMLKAQAELIEVAQQHQLVENSYKLSTGQTPTTFAINSYVTYIPPAGGRQKMQFERAGPFRVTQIIGDEYVITDLVNHKTITTHVTNLKAFKHDSNVHDVREIAVKNAGQFVIDRIVAHQGSKKRKTAMKFKVKWLGYPDPKHDTWEPYGNVRITQAFLDYCNNNKLKSIVNTSLVDNAAVEH